MNVVRHKIRIVFVAAVIGGPGAVQAGSVDGVKVKPEFANRFLKVGKGPDQYAVQCMSFEPGVPVGIDGASISFGGKGSPPSSVTGDRKPMLNQRSDKDAKKSTQPKTAKVKLQNFLLGFAYGVAIATFTWFTGSARTSGASRLHERGKEDIGTTTRIQGEKDL